MAAIKIETTFEGKKRVFDIFFSRCCCCCFCCCWLLLLFRAIRMALPIDGPWYCHSQRVSPVELFSFDYNLYSNCLSFIKIRFDNFGFFFFAWSAHFGLFPISRKNLEKPWLPYWTIRFDVKPHVSCLNSCSDLIVCYAKWTHIWLITRSILDLQIIVTVHFWIWRILSNIWPYLNFNFR